MTEDQRPDGKDRTDWERVDALTEEEIERAIANDPDAAPILDAEWFRKATRREPGDRRSPAGGR
jgi:hypothetical protein